MEHCRAIAIYQTLTYFASMSMLVAFSGRLDKSLRDESHTIEIATKQLNQLCINFLLRSLQISTADNTN